MQQEGTVKFLKFHQGSVRGVAFSPRDRYLFCSGAYDGKVNLYSAQRTELLMCYQISTLGNTRNVNAVRFTSDGSRILASTTARRLAVIDVERGEQVMSYDNCAFNGRDRAALAADPLNPHMAVCSCVNGKGLTIFDLRMPLPLDFVYDLHTGVIRDITFVHSGWKFVGDHEKVILSLSTDGVCKVTTLDGRYLHCFEVGHNANSIAPSPESYETGAEDGFFGLLMVGGDVVSGYIPDVGIQERLNEHGNLPIWKLRYTSNGGILYTACDGGIVRKYRRYPDHHTYLGEVYCHKGDIQDLDLSPYDEFLITASKDRSVGILRLGAPNHGWTEYCELS
ncbi:uncharacterized protein LOC129959462 isoform X2 [Argiope bruennichi]|uniref:Pre-mRNA-processing factor 17 like protein n=3 Tax=Araneidae TaxID=6913 RepID=A0A8T0F912_ARGBR|nr:uncharacterized protein LOC129959462 isoform X2 [Argiope bruennichi]KAF8785909.1 Pre-mRNA-processing factor 17 like protein [Argiope bruennichi]